MNREDAKVLVEQLQQAHRLSVGFYRRILPTLDVIANQLGCEFWDWGPLHNSRPPRSGSQPSDSWAWDYVPLYASGHTYGRCVDEKRTLTSDLAIEFSLYVEDSFEPSKRGVKGQPDPLKLPEGAAVLKALLYRPKGNYDKPFDDLWSEESDNSATQGKWSAVSKHFEAMAFAWPLEEVIAEAQGIIEKLKPHAQPADE